MYFKGVSVFWYYVMCDMFFVVYLYYNEAKYECNIFHSYDKLVYF